MRIFRKAVAAGLVLAAGLAPAAVLAGQPDKIPVELLNKGPVAKGAFPPRPPARHFRGPVIYAAPPVYTPYYAPPTYYAPSVAPLPTVVLFPDGRYELRGDGVATPHAWVLVPDPPRSPPPAAVSTAPPAADGPPAAPPAPSASDGPSAARRGLLFRWIDDEGVVHWTDRWDAIPEQYRARAKQSQPS